MAQFLGIKPFHALLRTFLLGISFSRFPVFHELLCSLIEFVIVWIRSEIIGCLLLSTHCCSIINIIAKTRQQLRAILWELVGQPIYGYDKLEKLSITENTELFNYKLRLQCNNWLSIDKRKLDKHSKCKCYSYCGLA